MGAPVIRSAIVATMTLIVTGCYDDVTEVVVAITSDLTPGTEVDTIAINYEQGNLTPSMFSLGFMAQINGASRFPMSVAFTSTEDGPKSFSIAVQLTKFDGFEQFIVASRKATAIEFVPQQTLMLVLPMLRACACQGTTCPNPGNPDCDDMVDPALLPLDPEVAPRGADIGILPGGGGGTPARPGVDGGAARPPPP
jgi:hypothetical protein